MKDRKALSAALSKILRYVSSQDEALAAQVGNSFADIMSEVGSRDRRTMVFYRRFAWAASAAAVLAGIMLVVGVLNDGRQQKMEDIVAAMWTRLIVPAGEHANVRLSDGTMLYANSGTEVELPSVFDAGKREIKVSGEVYLEVAEDAERPFHVIADGFEVRVLGTSFNVSAYPDDDAASVVLVKGSVAVSAGGQTGFISPGQKMEITGSGMSVSQVNVEEYVGWKDKVIIINGHPLSEILKKLQRYYGVSIVVESGVGDLMIDGKLDLQEDISSVMDNLCILLPLEYRKQRPDQYSLSLRR